MRSLICAGIALCTQGYYAGYTAQRRFFHVRALSAIRPLSLSGFSNPSWTSFRSQGKQLNRGECYGLTILPIFEGGSYTAENRFSLGATEHIRFTGDLHCRLRDVADSDNVRIEITR
jgi:Domain of unknown function (DUF1851)